MGPFPSLDDFTPDDLVRMADTHDDLAFAELLGAHPAMVQTGGLYEILTGIPNPYGNMLFGLEVPDAPHTVREVTDRLVSLAVPAFWWVGPCTLPIDVDRLLLQAGWQDGGAAPALIVELDRLSVPDRPAGFELVPVRSEDELRAWQEAFAAGYELPIEVAQTIAPRLDGPMTLFIVRLDGQDAGTTGIFLNEGVPGIYGVSTKPEFRRRGLGAAATAYPLLEARGRGYRLGTLQASSLGLPVYLKLGFRKVYDLRVFTFGTV